MCSECYACVKLCPQDAIHVRGYADFVPLGAMVQPKRVEQGLRWTRPLPGRARVALYLSIPFDPGRIERAVQGFY